MDKQDLYRRALQLIASRGTSDPVRCALDALRAGDTYDAASAARWEAEKIRRRVDDATITASAIRPHAFTYINDRARAGLCPWV